MAKKKEKKKAKKKDKKVVHFTEMEWDLEKQRWYRIGKEQGIRETQTKIKELLNIKEHTHEFVPQIVGL